MGELNNYLASAHVENDGLDTIIFQQSVVTIFLTEYELKKTSNTN